MKYWTYFLLLMEGGDQQFWKLSPAHKGVGRKVFRRGGNKKRPKIAKKDRK